jgi:hypothetical protein
MGTNIGQQRRVIRANDVDVLVRLERAPGLETWYVLPHLRVVTFLRFNGHWIKRLGAGDCSGVI